MSVENSTLPALDHSAWRPAANPWLITVAVMLGTFMEVLDTSVANVSLPHIAGNLSASVDESTWELTSYLISNAIVLPMTGWLGRFFGRKNFLVFCIALFTVASFLCGSATTLPMLVAARVVQGIGGGALQPIAQSIMLESFPPAKRAAAMAAYAFGIIFAPIIGPTLGGWITDNYSWRWVFYINIPVGVLAILMVNSLIEDPPWVKGQKPGSIDFWGFGFLALWLGTFQVVLDRGQQEDWFGSKAIVWMTVISVVSFGAFIGRELLTKEPLVDLHVLKNRNLATGVVVVAVVGVVLYATTALIPLFLQGLMGYPALQSGLAVSPRGIGSMASIFMIGWLAARVDLRWLIAGALGLLGYTSWMLGNINLGVSTMSITLPIVASGFAISSLFIPLSVATTATLKREQMGSATGIFNLMRNLGGSVGISLVTTLLSRGSQSHQAAMAGHVNMYDPAVQQRVAALEQWLGMHSDPVTAGARAKAMMSGTLSQQAVLWAYVDNFRLLGVLCFVCVPLVFLFSKAKKTGMVEVH
jgi:MFS transporter, DHA2 family, multidrug resistance protein